MSDPPSFGADREDRRRLLAEQRNEYQHLLDQTERVLRLVLTVLALIGSSLSAQYVFSIQIPKTLVTVDRETFNRVAPDAVRASTDVTVHGFGEINFTIAVGVLALGLLLLVEMVILAVCVLTLPRLRPFEGGPGDRDERRDGGYDDWIRDNYGRIGTAAERLRTAYRKLLYAVVLTILAGLLLTAVYFDVLWLLLLLDAVVFALSFAALLALALETYRTIGAFSSDVGIARLEWILTRNVGPLCTVGLLPVDYYAMKGSGRLIQVASMFDLWGQFPL